MLSKAMAIAAAAAMAGPLPSGYAQCEYLQNTGVQIIHLGHKIAPMDFEIKTSLLSIGQNYYAAHGMNSSVLQTGFSPNGYFTNGQSTAQQVKAYSINVPYVFSGRWETGAMDFKVDGEVAVPKRGSVSEGELFLFGYTWEQRASIMRLYYAKIGDMNLIPCIRSSDLKPGVYDTVSKRFFVNQGTGEFLFGPLKIPSGLTQSGDPYMYQGHGCVDVIINWSGRNAIYDLVTRTITYYNE